MQSDIINSTHEDVLCCVHVCVSLVFTWRCGWEGEGLIFMVDLQSQTKPVETSTGR